MKDVFRDWPEMAQVLAQSGLSIKEIEYDSDLPVLGVVFYHNTTLAKKPCFSVKFSPELFSRGLEGHRLQAMSFIRLIAPTLLPFAKERFFSIRFNFDDSGSTGYLSMDRPVGSDWPLIPDRYLLERATSPLPLPMSFAQFKLIFAAKRKVLFWRGSTTGSYSSTPDNFLNNRRVSACIKLSECSADLVDCKISRIVQLNGNMTQSEAYKILESYKLFGAETTESDFANYQMTLDLPGNVSAWGTCLKYLLGCLILRPTQDRELFYTHLLKPGIHFLPIESDFSNLMQTLNWVLDHQDEAASIAWNGRNIMIDILRDTPHMLQRAIKCNGKFDYSRKSSAITSILGISNFCKRLIKKKI